MKEKIYLAVQLKRNEDMEYEIIGENNGLIEKHISKGESVDINGRQFSDISIETHEQIFNSYVNQAVKALNEELFELSWTQDLAGLTQFKCVVFNENLESFHYDQCYINISNMNIEVNLCGSRKKANITKDNDIIKVLSLT